MQSAIQWLVACLLIITAIVMYFPIVFIRKLNRTLAVLERIETNTRAAEAGERSTGSAQTAR